MTNLLCCSSNSSKPKLVEDWDGAYSAFQDILVNLGSSKLPPEHLAIDYSSSRLESLLERMDEIRRDTEEILHAYEKNRNLTLPQKLASSKFTPYLEAGLWLLGIGGGITQAGRSMTDCDDYKICWISIAVFTALGIALQVKGAVLKGITKEEKNMGELKRLSARIKATQAGPIAMFGKLQAYKETIDNSSRYDRDEWVERLRMLKTSKLPKEFQPYFMGKGNLQKRCLKTVGFQDICREDSSSDRERNMEVDLLDHQITKIKRRQREEKGLLKEEQGPMKKEKSKKTDRIEIVVQQPE